MEPPKQQQFITHVDYRRLWVTPDSGVTCWCSQMAAAVDDPNLTERAGVMGRALHGAVIGQERPSWQHQDSVLFFSGCGGIELGNLGRNTLRAPGLQEFDPSFFKNWSFSEPMKLQFRAEVFNALNRPNFQMKSPRLFDGSGNVIPTATILGPPTATSARKYSSVSE